LRHGVGCRTSHAVCGEDMNVRNNKQSIKQTIRDTKRILRRQKGTVWEREYLFAHINKVKGRLGWI
jgi:hypothetical protein